MKILIVSVFVAGIIMFFGNFKKKEKTTVVGLCVITIIAAVISNGIVSVLPMPKDRIQLTALGEKNPNALSDEVSLKEVIVDDIHYQIDDAVEGKWFWEGDNYMWRNENDSRKPEGVTRSITLEIPKGNSRQLVFSDNVWRGLVEITYNGESQMQDLYNENWTDDSVNVPGNGLFTAYMLKLGKLVLFVLIIAALIAYFLFAALKYDYGVIRAWFGRNWDKLFYAAIAIVYIFVIQSVSAEGSLWYDEMWQLGWYYNGSWPKEQHTIFSLLFTLWIRCMPYGQEYLRLLSQLFVAGAIYFAGLIGSNFKSKRLGVLLSSIVAFSGSIIYQCSMGVRDYAMMFFTTTLMIYFFIKKQNSKDNPKAVSMILYGIFIALAMDIHMMNVIVAGLLMIADFILILLKKASKKCLLAFICPAIYGVYWIINVFFNFLNANGGYTSWVDSISIARVWDFVRWVFSYNDLMIFVAIVGFIYIITKSVSHLVKKIFDFNKDFAALTIMLIPLLQILIIIIYSATLPVGSMFIDRYFISSFICMFFVLAIGFDIVIDWVGQLKKNRTNMSIITAIVICSMSLYSWTQIEPWNPWSRMYRTTNQDFKIAAEYVMQQNDCYSPSTLFIVDHSDIIGATGMKYYLTHNGKKDDISFCSIWESKVVQGYFNVYVSYVCGADRANSDLNQFLDNEYELVSDDTSAKVKKYVRITD